MISHSTASRIAQFTPFQEPVTYYARTSADNFTAYQAARARRKKVEKADKGFEQSILATAELVWVIVADYLPVEPRQDDYLLDSNGVKYVVIASTIQFNGRVYELATRKV